MSSFPVISRNFCDHAMAKKPQKRYLQVFKDSYKTEFPFILQSSRGNYFAFCSVCRCDINISHGGKTDIVTHSSTQKHKDSASCLEKNKKLSNFFVGGKDDSAVTRAECLFTSFIVEHNLSLSCSEHAGQLFRKMFPDSDIAKKYACARTKTSAIINEMARDADSQMIQILRKEPFAISTDGSNDRDSKLYPVVVSFFNQESKTIENRLLSMENLEGDSTGANIANLLLGLLERHAIPVANCIAFSADNAPVMIGRKNGVAAKLKQQCPNMIVVGCPCHLIHLAAEKGADSLPVKIDEMVIDIYYYLDKSSKRKDHLKVYQDLYQTDVRKILKHVCTRWLSLGKCLERLISQWQPLQSFFKDEVKQSTSTNTSLKYIQIPKIKTYEHRHSEIESSAVASSRVQNQARVTSGKRKVISSSSSPTVKRVKGPCETISISRQERLFLFLSSDLNKAFCLFLVFAIPTFEKYNKVLQSQAPHIHVLRSILIDMLTEILCRFVKPVVIKKYPSILEVDYHTKENQKTDDDLIIGSSTSSLVENLTPEEKKTFFLHVRKYFIAASDYINHKFNLDSEVFVNAQVAQINSLSTASFSAIKYFILKFPIMLPRKEGEDEHQAMDVLQCQFCALQMEDLPSCIVDGKRADFSWSAIGDIRGGDGCLKYDRVARVMLSILKIPHSNAECERLFSQVKKTRTQFRSSLNDENLSKLLVVKSNQNGKCYEQQYDAAFLKRAKSATSSSLNQ